MITIKLEKEIELGRFYGYNIKTDLICCKEVVDIIENNLKVGIHCKDVVLNFPFKALYLYSNSVLAKDCNKISTIDDNYNLHPVNISDVKVYNVNELYVIDSNVNNYEFKTYDEIKVSNDILNNATIDMITMKLQSNYNNLKYDEFIMQEVDKHVEAIKLDFLERIEKFPKEELVKNVHAVVGSLRFCWAMNLNRIIKEKLKHYITPWWK